MAQTNQKQKPQPQPQPQPRQKSKAYLTLALGPATLGTMELLLHSDIVPKTCLNFLALCRNASKPCYLNSPIHRVIRGFMLQGGDFTRGDGTGGRSIYGARGEEFEDENFDLKHRQRGTLSMANRGPNTNGSQFFITFKAAEHLDGRHVVFGEVVMGGEGEGVLRAVEMVETGRNDVPTKEVWIKDCGVLDGEEEEEEEGGKAEAEAEADAEEEKEKEKDKDNENEVKKAKNGSKTPRENYGSESEEEEEEQDPTQTSAFAAMTSVQQRLYLLKMSMNKSRNLNRRETYSEGQRTTERGARKERKKLAGKDRQDKQKEFIGDLKSKGFSKDSKFMMEVSERNANTNTYTNTASEP